VEPHSNSTIAGFSTPLGQGRLWVTLLWSLTLAVGLAALDWAERQFFEAAVGQTLVLLPARALDETQRQAERARLSGEPGVTGVQWRSPAELTRQVSRRFPQSQWKELFPTDEAWLPWVLEARPVDPLGEPEQVRSFIARRQKEGTWRLVLWDGAAIQNLARQRSALRWVFGFWLLLGGLTGAVALARMPWPGRGGVGLFVWSALLGLLGPAAVWCVALLAETGADDRSLGIALGSGFILAAAAAPLLRLRRTQSHSITISEDSHERVR
jgi:hypothetical protein